MSRTDKPMMKKLLAVLKHKETDDLCIMVPRELCNIERRHNCENCVGAVKNKAQLIKELEASL